MRGGEGRGVVVVVVVKAAKAGLEGARSCSVVSVRAMRSPALCCAQVPCPVLCPLLLCIQTELSTPLVIV